MEVDKPIQHCVRSAKWQNYHDMAREKSELRILVLSDITDFMDVLI